MSGTNTPVKKVHPVIQYFGGKFRVAQEVVKQFPKHHTYAEVFAGGLSVLLSKEPSRNEIVNDYDTELLHLYKMIKFRLAELNEGIEKIPISRRLFEDWLKQDPLYLNDTYRAVRKLYIIRLGFGGLARTFGTDRLRSRFNHALIKGWLDDFWRRTSQVTFECLDATHFLEVYDHRDTFFYLDPVYLGKDAYHQKFGGKERHTQLRDALKRVKGKWLLSHHDCPEIRAIYKGFKVRYLDVSYTVAGRGRKPAIARELLIGNY